MRQTFQKKERLCSRKKIGTIFVSGTSMVNFPLRLIWIEQQPEEQTQITFSIPKKLFKRAVDRNLLKRRLRECYRKQKHQLYDGLKAAGKSYAMVWVYTSREILAYNVPEKATNSSIQRLLNGAKSIV